MQKTRIIAGTLGIAAIVAGGLTFIGTDDPNPTQTAQRPPTEAAPPARASAQPAVPSPAQPDAAAPAQVAPPDNPGPRVAALSAPLDTSAFFHRPYNVEHICDGDEYRVLDSGETVRLKKCRSVDRNPSIYRDDPTEQLMSDIEAGQPWAIEAMEVLGMRFMAQGQIYAGLGMLKEHAARTGKVGLLAVAQTSYMHGTTLEDSKLDYEIMRILIAKGYPALPPRRASEQRTRLLNAGVTPQQLDALDARIDRYISNIAPADTGPVGHGGAS